MTSHISDELPRLLTGDAPREVVLEAAEHLRTCADCQQDLVSAVVAHASLMSAHRFAPEVVSRDAAESTEEDAPPAALPDLSDMFSQVREEAAAPASQPIRRRALLAVAASAVVVAGGGAVVAGVISVDDTPAARTVSLAAFDEGKEKDAASAKLWSNRLQINAAKLPKLDATHQYEVWLTDRNRTRMQSVGFIGNDKTADLKIPSKVISQYNDIEISVQKIDQDKYSGTSVVRGSYG